jgi:hypothetical protein
MNEANGMMRWMLNSALSSKATVSTLFPFLKLKIDKSFLTHGLFARNVIPTND